MHLTESSSSPARTTVPAVPARPRTYLGSLEVTTDATDDAVFNVPFTPPAGLPIVTATATDPQGNTSEVSALRQTTLQVTFLVCSRCRQPVKRDLGQSGGRYRDPGPRRRSARPGLEPDALGLERIAEPASIAGLTGSGDGTGIAVVYRWAFGRERGARGPDLHAARGSARSRDRFLRRGIRRHAFTRDAVRHHGRRPLVDTTADSGPGSLRQAILDANTVTGQTVTIDFAIPGSGVQTIELASPLPAITASVSIDGSSQPEFAGTPLIALGGESTDVTITDGNLTIRGLSLSQVAIDASTSEQLLATEDNNGLTTGLTLLDSQGNVLVRGNGLSTANRESVLDEYLAAGTYSVVSSGVAGVGNASLSLSLTPASSPSQPIPVTGLATLERWGIPA